jgi:hypothetical protein
LFLLEERVAVEHQVLLVLVEVVLVVLLFILTND